MTHAEATHMLVGGLEHLEYFFQYIGNFIIPTDGLICFRGVGIPPTRYSGKSFQPTSIDSRKKLFEHEDLCRKTR